MGNVLKTSYSVSELQDFRLEFSHDEIIENLRSEDVEDFVKIFSVINLEKINSIQEMKTLFYNLTNHPTPIREVVALKIEEIYQDIYFDEEIKEQFLKAIIDINPNVCRAICATISKWDFLSNELRDDIVLEIKNLLSEIKACDKELGGFYENALKIRKNHAKNKKLFSLYWFLEALSVCNIDKNNAEVLEILNATIKFNDYTIREKTAKILTKIDYLPENLLRMVQEDQNFYVKNQVYDKINNED